MPHQRVRRAAGDFASSSVSRVPESAIVVEVREAGPSVGRFPERFGPGEVWASRRTTRIAGFLRKLPPYEYGSEP
jgi:hypothetical protein